MSWDQKCIFAPLHHSTDSEYGNAGQVYIDYGT